MGQTTIEWTSTVGPDGTVYAGYTFNPWIGCTKVHEGCTNCYAEADMDKRRGRVKWGPHGTRSKTSESYWNQPLKWHREAERLGVRLKVFCASLADVFEEWDAPVVDHQGEQLWYDTAFCPATMFSGVETAENQLSLQVGVKPVTLDDLRRDLFALIDQTPHLDWILLTKRPENIRRMWSSRPSMDNRVIDQPYRANVMLLTSISNQEHYDKQAPHLWRCRDLCPVLGFSAEPLLGPIKLWNEWDGKCVRNWQGCWDWVIAGGESGPKARPCHPDWVRSLRDQCTAAGVAFFFKQWGEWWPRIPGTGTLGDSLSRRNDPIYEETTVMWWRVGKKAAGATLEGREWREYPEVIP